VRDDCLVTFGTDCNEFIYPPPTPSDSYIRLINDNGIIAEANWTSIPTDAQFEGSVIWNADKTTYKLRKEDRHGLRAEMRISHTGSYNPYPEGNSISKTVDLSGKS